MPVRQLAEILCEKTVTAELKERKKEMGISKTAVMQLTSYVCNKAQKIFAILVTIERVGHINQFFKAGFNDTMLPLSRNGSNITPAAERFCDTVKEAFKEWTSQGKRHFCDNQWAFLSPVFQQSKYTHDIHKRCPMPVLEINSKLGNSTNFSEVHQWVVHQDHLETDQVTL